jgi:hypothetical protein
MLDLEVGKATFFGAKRKGQNIKGGQEIEISDSDLV